MNLGALDERYRELYSGSAHSELGFSVKAAGNAVVMGMTQAENGCRAICICCLRTAGSCTALTTGSAWRRSLNPWNARRGLSGDSQGESPERMVLVSETGLLQDLAIEITGRGGTVLCPLFFQ